MDRQTRVLLDLIQAEQMPPTSLLGRYFKGYQTNTAYPGKVLFAGIITSVVVLGKKIRIGHTANSEPIEYDYALETIRQTTCSVVNDGDLVDAFHIEPRVGDPGMSDDS